MRLVMGGINGQYLRDITENCADKTDKVLVAVAYATDAKLLFDWCWERKIPLEYYGRLDAGVAVSSHILEAFLKRKSPDFVCRLVERHHAKVIWWQGYGVYIGSANLTHSAWNKNIEAGCFFSQEEINDEMVGNLDNLFRSLKKIAKPLNEELLDLMKKMTPKISLKKLGSGKFWKEVSAIYDEMPKSLMNEKGHWGRDVYKALRELGREVHLDEIYQKLEEIYHSEGRKPPKGFKHTARRVLQERSSDSKTYDGRFEDLFSMKGKGIWALR